MVVGMVHRLAAALALAVMSVGCGEAPPVSIQAGNNINGGVIVISQAATYSYVLLSGCVPAYEFRLRSDAGSTHWLPQSTRPSTPSMEEENGQLYLTAGKWQGQWFYRPRLAPEPCSWAMTLTSS